MSRGRGVILAFVAAVAVSIAAPAGSQGSIVVGSDLTLQPSDVVDNCILTSPPCTHLLTRAHNTPSSTNPQDILLGAGSPTVGTVTGFSIRTASSASVTFRLGRLVDQNAKTYIGDGTGPTVTLPGAGTYSFPTLLPIRIGDYVGIDSSAVQAYAGECFGRGSNAGAVKFHPVLIDGGSPEPVVASAGCELLVNATVEPSNAFSFGKVKRSKARGKAILPADLPGPGSLTIGGHGLKQIPGVADRAGLFRCQLTPNARSRRLLERTGRARVRARVTFTPKGGAPSAQQRRVTLVKKG